MLLGCFWTCCFSVCGVGIAHLGLIGWLVYVVFISCLVFCVVVGFVWLICWGFVYLGLVFWVFDVIVFWVKSLFIILGFGLFALFIRLLGFVFGGCWRLIVLWFD